MPQKIADLDATKPIQAAAAEFRPASHALVVLSGSFDAALNEKIRSLLSRVVVPLAVESGALILDDGKATGCAPLVAAAALAQDSVPQLIGIVPANRDPADIDANHELVLRLPAVWSAQTKYWFQIAASLGPEAEESERVCFLLFGGGATEKQAVLWCARRGWPVLVIGNTGGLADQIVSTTQAADGSWPATVDPDLREILETATIYRSSLDAGVDDLNRILAARLAFSTETFTGTLKEAWRRYDEIDLTANQKQWSFRWLQGGLITLGVLAALFAILKSITLPAALLTFVHKWHVLPGTLHVLVIVTPLAISILAGVNSHLRDGIKWILLRGTAEALKREIFRFRSQTGEYSDEQCIAVSRESKLMAKLRDITASLEQSEVNKTSLLQPASGDDKRNTKLTAEEYLLERVENQIAYYDKNTRKLSIQLTAAQWLILLAGGAGTLLAAIKLDIWIAFTTALATALTTKLQADQSETTLVQYNQALTGLKNIAAWWKARSPWEKGRRKNIDLLVDQTEKILETETAGWVQQMQSALEKLTETEASGNKK